MLRVTENNDEIIIREMPVAKWSSSLLAAIFLFIAVFGMSSGTFSSNMTWILATSAFIGAICWFQTFNTLTTIKINTPGKIVSVRKQSLLKYSFNVYSFDEIADFVYLETSDVTAYQLVMPTKDGLKIKLSSAGGSNDGEYFKAVDSINKHIFGATPRIPFRTTL